jgi:hypothetical protein
MLAEQGFGFTQGEGPTMTYQPDPKELQLQIDLESAVAQSGQSPSARIDTVDAEMTQVSTAEAQLEQISQPPADIIDLFEKSSETSFCTAESHRSQASDLIQLPSTTQEEIAQQSIKPAEWMHPSQSNNKNNHQVMASQPGSPDESANNHHQVLVQRGRQVLAWVKDQWILSTYLKPLDAMIVSHRTGRLDAGHQILLPDDSHHLCNTHQPGTHRIAAADLRFSIRLDTDIGPFCSV